MGGLVDIFTGGGGDSGGGYTPPPLPPAPVAPTIEDADTKTRENEDKLKRRKGRAALVLTGKSGAGTPQTATKALTGE